MTGTFLLYRVPINLKNQTPNEINVIEEFWETEKQKCLYQAERLKYRKVEKEEEEKWRSIEESK